MCGGTDLQDSVDDDTDQSAYTWHHSKGGWSLNLQFSCHCVANFVTPQLYSTLVKVVCLGDCGLFFCVHSSTFLWTSKLPEGASRFLFFRCSAPFFCIHCSSFMESRACYLPPAVKVYVHRIKQTVLV